MKKGQTTNYKVVFMNKQGSVMDTRYLNTKSLKELDSEANKIAKGLLEYSSAVSWEASAVVRKGVVVEKEHEEQDTALIEVLVSITPMVNNNRYFAKVWKSEEALYKILDTSMRGLLVQLKEKAMENSWSKDKLKIKGDFYDLDLTKDDEIVWKTPIWDL